jgi:hypothetical protein
MLVKCSQQLDTKHGRYITTSNIQNAIVQRAVEPNKLVARIIRKSCGALIDY